MKRTTMWPLLRALFLCACAVSLAARPAVAQINIYGTFGSAGYDDDEFCLGSDAAITSIGVGVDGTVLGGEVGYNNSDWPWPPRPGTGNNGAFSVAGRGAFSRAQQEERYLTHGNAFTGMIKLFPLPILRTLGLDGLLGTADRFVRPFVGVGVQISTDGTTSAAGDARPLPTDAVKGSTNLVVTYGATVLLPGRDTPIGLILGYRGAKLFANEVDIETAAGQTETVDAGSLSWTEWSVGFRYRLGS
jgi:hypothetical protein